MSKYFFHLRNDVAVPDRTGLNLRTEMDAERYAKRLCTQLNQGGGDWTVTVTDQDGTGLFEVRADRQKVAYDDEVEPAEKRKLSVPPSGSARRGCRLWLT